MIKDWILRLPDEARLLVVLAASLAALVALFLFISAGSVFITAWSRVEFAEPRISRLLGYEAVEEDLVSAVREAEDVLSEYAFSEEIDASRRGAELQQALRAFAGEAGLSVIGSQFVRQADSDFAVPEGFEALGVDLTMNGPHAALDTFLRDVSEYEPGLKVMSLELQQPRRKRTPAGAKVAEDVNIKANVVALRVNRQ